MGIPSQLTAGRARAGIALPTVTLALALVAIMVATAFRLNSAGAKTVASRDAGTRALMLAEEGAAHAVTVLRENLAGRTSGQLLVGPDGSASGLADNGLLVWSELSSALQIPSTGKATTGGIYRVRILDDPGETDGQPLVDRNERVLVECVGTATDGSSATVNLIVRSAPTPGIAVDGNFTMSGGVVVKGACGSVHVNGSVNAGTNAVVAGQLSATGTVTGTIEDTLGNVNPPKNGVESMDIPDLDPMAGCATRDFRLYKSGTNGYLYQRSTNTTFNITSLEVFGWKMSSADPVIFTMSGLLGVDGSVCAEGNVTVSGNPGTALLPKSMSIYASGHIDVSGNPFLVPAAGDSVLLMAGGDLKLSGNADVGRRNYEGMVYGESQCGISGNPRISGQFVCKNKPDPAGAKDLLAATSISGNPEITYNCTGKFAGRRRVLLWNQPVP